MRRGEIWVANLNPNRGQEVGKIRPVVVIQDDRLLATALPTVLVLPLTTQVNPEFEPLRITVRAREKLHQNCQIMVEQVRTLDRTRAGEGREVPSYRPLPFEAKRRSRWFPSPVLQWLPDLGQRCAPPRGLARNKR